MKFVSYKEEHSNTDITKDEHLSSQIKTCIKILNSILEECSKENINVDFQLKPTLSVVKNQRIIIKSITKDLK